MTDEQAAIQAMIDAKLMHGTFDPSKAGHPATFYYTRRTFLDFRGPLSIHPQTGWGWFAMVLTTSHDAATGATVCGENVTPVVARGVTIDEGAYICSRALLYNCHIGHHAIVACGAVVRNMDVPPYTVVEGNPARIVKRFVDGRWEHIERQCDE